MFNYSLLSISVVFFLIGVRSSIQNKIITKGENFVISMSTTFFLCYSILFLACDYITGNGVDYAIIYYLREGLTGSGFRWYLFLTLQTIIGVIISIFVLYTVINRIVSTTMSKKRKAVRPGLMFYLFALLSFIFHPTAYGYLNNFHLSKSAELRSEVQTKENRYDLNRFIAHAGGKIEGNTYTNSLEALNLSYKNGFRLFELDIIRTSDNIFVAVHDWNHWRSVTGFKGKLPPTRAIFKQYKFMHKYTPLDINDINNWFNNHQDATLVTDKVNTPSEFSNLFIDKSRLMMELFTLDAVKEGVRTNIKSVMPTWSILSKIKGDKVQALLEFDITDIVASRRIIKNNIPLINRLKSNGIKIYVFHVNFDEGKDETSVFCNDMDYIYGLYADEFDFQEKIDCGEYDFFSLLTLNEDA